MWNKNVSQNGGGKTANLPIGACARDKSRAEAEADYEVQAGNEEDEEVLPWGEVQESGHG